MFIIELENVTNYIHIPPLYILYRRENWCMTRPGGNGLSFLCAVAFFHLLAMAHKSILEPMDVAMF